MVFRGLADTDHPVLAQMIPVRRCNLSCTYCNEYDKTSDPVPTAEIIRRIDQLAALGVSVITMSGGEPMLHPDLDALFPATSSLLEGTVDTDADGDYEADQWRDAGVWLAALLLPLLALGFRRGFIAAWLAFLILPLPRAEDAPLGLFRLAREVAAEGRFALEPDLDALVSAWFGLDAGAHAQMRASFLTPSRALAGA